MLVRFAFSLLLLALAACGSREVLLPRDGEPPGDVSFAGTWQLQGDFADIERRISRAVRRTDGLRDRMVLSRGPEQQRRGDGRSDGGLAHVFLENGRVLKITQTPSALFISFDRAVVEEYRFGEDRLINVGQAEAQRVSGWEGQDYIVETLDRNGMKLTERWSLEPGADTLTRHITFRSKGGDTVSVGQEFRRR